MPVTALYAAILTLIFVILSARVIAQRGRSRVSLGDGGDDDLVRRIRVHGNFAEYVPLALILMALAESLRVELLIVHALGVLLVAARLLHALGMGGGGRGKYRVAGMALTFFVLAAGALLCAFGAIWHGI